MGGWTTVIKRVERVQMGVVIVQSGRGAKSTKMNGVCKHSQELAATISMMSSAAL